jgi:hypothetical protein
LRLRRRLLLRLLRLLRLLGLDLGLAGEFLGVKVVL